MGCDDYDDRKTEADDCSYTVNPVGVDETPVFHTSSPRAVGPLSIVGRWLMWGTCEVPWYLRTNRALLTIWIR